MEDYQEAMVKSLVAVAWADGRVDEAENEVIEALISAFGLSDEDADSIREYAKTKRSMDEIPLSELSKTDRRTLLQHAVILAYVDGEKSEKEQEVLMNLVAQLRISDEEATALIDNAEARAKDLLSLL